MSRFQWPSRRKWMLAALLMLGVAGAYFALKLKQAHRQSSIVQMIQEYRGAVVYDYQFSGSARQYTINRDAAPPGPAWLRGLLGIDFFCDPVLISLQQTLISDSDVANLRHLPRLYILDLRYTSISDQGIQQLQDLPSLRRLSLGGSQVTDQGITRFKVANPQCVAP